MTIEKIIAEQLRRLRTSRNLTQEDVADMLKVKRQTYSAYERCVSIPDAITLKKLADFFGVTTDHILGGSQTPELSVIDEKKERLTIEDALDGFGITTESRRQAFRELTELILKAENNAELAKELDESGYGTKCGS